MRDEIIEKLTKWSRSNTPEEMNDMAEELEKLCCEDFDAKIEIATIILDRDVPMILRDAALGVAVENCGDGAYILGCIDTILKVKKWPG